MHGSVDRYSTINNNGKEKGDTPKKKLSNKFVDLN